MIEAVTLSSGAFETSSKYEPRVYRFTDGLVAGPDLPVVENGPV